MKTGRLRAKWLPAAAVIFAMLPLGLLACFSAADLVSRLRLKQATRAEDRLMPDETRCSPGPWGRNLRCIELMTTTPAAFLSAEQLMQTYARGWLLPGVLKKDLQTALRQEGLHPNVLQVVLSFEAVDTPKGLRIRPLPERVWSLSPEQRRSLYSILATCPENVWQCYPVIINADLLDAGLANGNLQPATREKFKRLLYDHENLKCFADTPLLLSQVEDAAERTCLLQMLSSRPFLRMENVVLPEEDFDRQVKYWGRGMAAKDVVPLLHALAGRQPGYRLDAIHLLPPLPRARFATWTTSAPRTGRHLEQSLSMALNFFEQDLVDSPADEPRFLALLDRHYFPPAGGVALGDIVLFRSEDSQLVHCCNYVAENIAYGRWPGPLPSAWCLSTMDDLELALAVHSPVTTEIYRRRSH